MLVVSIFLAQPFFSCRRKPFIAYTRIEKSMDLNGAIVGVFKSRRFWFWEVAGAIIYGIPVAIRFATKSVTIPILNFPGFWIGHIIPGNFLEKVLVNAFFPGGAGGVAGEIFVVNFKGYSVKGRLLYYSRLGGALFQTTVWSLIQFFGYTLFIIGPYGSNIFEFPVVVPINFVLASFSIFTPTVLYFIQSKFSNLRLKRASNIAK